MLTIQSVAAKPLPLFVEMGSLGGDMLTVDGTSGATTQRHKYHFDLFAGVAMCVISQLERGSAKTSFMSIFAVVLQCFAACNRRDYD